ncbi:hypothetical protein Taro_043167 [Colocasia esculenta]|uniref:WIT1/2 N-terminal helical bundle domain-containing protein n=1 Tax=Colocasia esculenta TaxID=4460 RepID=A0A843X041_COLES|nr:hypothetical protein [Colocasia esculenta]
MEKAVSFKLVGSRNRTLRSVLVVAWAPAPSPPPPPPPSQVAAAAKNSPRSSTGGLCRKEQVLLRALSTGFGWGWLLGGLFRWIRLVGLPEVVGLLARLHAVPAFVLRVEVCLTGRSPRPPQASDPSECQLWSKWNYKCLQLYPRALIERTETMAVSDDLGWDVSINEDILADGDGMSDTENDREAFTRMEHHLAYCSEKVLNLDNLLVHVASRLSEYESPATENDLIFPDAIKKAFEFDMLLGILDSELRDLDNSMNSLQREIRGGHLKLRPAEHFEIFEIQEKLQNAEESLRQFREQVCEIRMQSVKFEGVLDFEGKETWNDGVENFAKHNPLSSKDGTWTLQTAKQQKHILQMLEKSLARVLELEKRIPNSRCNEDEINLKLQILEQEKYCIEEPMEAIHERLFETENFAEILMGISKELMSRLQIVQFNLSGSRQREEEMRSKLQESLLKLSVEESASLELKARNAVINNSLVQQANSLKASLKETEGKYDIANSEMLALRDKVNSLEKKLKESDIHLLQSKAVIQASQDQQSILHSEFIKMESVIEDLRKNIMMAENRANSVEAKCTLLTKTNLELNEELSFIRTNGKNQENLLECKLKESEARLNHAKACIEATEKQQNSLYITLSQKDNLIEDLKAKFLEAERKAENAESKCPLWNETNLELKKELDYLRGKLECLERSLRQVNEEKMAIARDIGVRTRVITDLVTELALERERLQIQISGLIKENKTLGEKLWERTGCTYSTSSNEINDNGKGFGFAESLEESVTYSSTNIQVCPHTFSCAIERMLMFGILTDILVGGFRSWPDLWKAWGCHLTFVSMVGGKQGDDSSLNIRLVVTM